MTLGPLMIDITGLQLDADDRRRLTSPLVGGVILFARNYESPEQLRALIAAVHALRQPPLLITVDQEGGRVQRFRDGFTQLPPAHWFGHQFDLDESQGNRLARLAGWLMAAELLDLGVDLSFSPVVDLDRGLSEVIGDRALHRDPDSVANLAWAWMQGMRDAGMAAVAKHFPGHGGVVADSHHELPEDTREYADLQDDLLPFRRLIGHGLPAVMVAHVRYPRVDRRIASLSPYWLQTELRGNLGFGGAVFSDDLNMSALAESGNMLDRTRTALAAGADVVLICNNPDAVDEVLADLEEDSGPASHGRLAALRPHRIDWTPGALRATANWESATAALQDSLEPPGLALDG
ncbi:MAG: beta-N-acetylhexosaminidase [Gammaproteobacteria bacterium]|nr:beta-N-acetylhexosaminidase [Gammaproteobacteria bacterium]